MQKIIVADRNRLLREMLTRAINLDENLEIVSILNSDHLLYDHVQKLDVDWVIVSFADRQKEPPFAVKEILANYPEVGVLVVSPDGSHVRVKWFETHERVLDGICLKDLIQLLSDGLSTEEELSREI